MQNLFFFTTPHPAWATTVDTTVYDRGAWNPLLVGALIGVLAWFTFYFSAKPIGASSFYATVTGFILKLVAPASLKKLEYYREHPPKVNWEFLFVLSAIAGAFLAALSGGEFSVQTLPKMWSDHFGSESLPKYAAVSVAGGALMGFGARMAGGCTSGHGISGTLQLAVSSWIALVCFFVGGALAIRLIY